MKPLEILVGDDLFMDPIVSRYMEKSLNTLATKLAPKYEMKMTQASFPAEMLREAQKGTYDIIVSDLDYGTTGRVGTEGFDIVEKIAAMQLAKKPYVILCTSSDSHDEGIQQRLKSKVIDAYVGSGAINKFKALVDHIAEKYA
jgi:hypothetical protein